MTKSAKALIGISYIATLLLGLVVGQTKLVGEYNIRINDMLDRVESLQMEADTKMAYTDRCLAGWYMK